MSTTQQIQPPSALDLPDDLLDAMKDLRDQGLQDDLAIPQIIVCGDQSSGKSSVLEAISRFGFPAKGTFCTRFVTEVNLRLAPVYRCSAEIRPADDRSEEQRCRLLAFKDNHVISGPQDLAKVIEAADQELRGLDRNVTIYPDTLVIRIEGPDQKPLSVIDLPGLIQATAEGQADDDLNTVRHIMKKYMEMHHSIILAVVAADNNLSNQEVVRMARENNGKSRTLGIITKPDRVFAGSPEERLWLDIAQDKGNEFGLGWHVLRNRDFANKNVGFEERDAIEARFFRESRWNECRPSTLGIAALRRRLRDIQMKAISSGLPALIEKVADLVNVCRQRKSDLGEPMNTDQERAALLADINRRIHGHIDDGVQGRSSASFPIHVRARIRRSLEEFADLMNREGRSYEMVPETDHSKASEKLKQDKSASQNTNSTMFLDAGEVLRSFKHQQHKRFPIKVTNSIVEDAITEHIKQRPGCEPPGVCSPDLWRVLFRMQVAPWKSMLQTAVRNVFQEVRDFFESVVHAVGPEHVADNILECIAEPAWRTSFEKLEAKTDEILYPYLSGEFFTLETARIHEIVRNSRKQVVVSDASAVTADESNRRFTALHSWNLMQEYLNIARATVLENFANLAVEQCLVKDLRRILLDPDIPITDTDLTNRIVDEPDNIKQLRDKNTRQLEALLRITTVLNKHRRSRGVSQGRRPEGPTARRSPSVQRRKVPVVTASTEHAEVVRVKGKSLEVEKANLLGVQTPPRTPERAI